MCDLFLEYIANGSGAVIKDGTSELHLGGILGLNVRAPAWHGQAPMLNPQHLQLKEPDEKVVQTHTLSPWIAAASLNETIRT